MRVSLNWLKEFVDISLTVDELAHTLTMLGLEIEAIERPGAEIEGLKTGKILSIDPHPDADKLVVCKTDVGLDEPLQIVCGAKNMKPGDIVPTALIGAKLPGGFEIGRRKMRGIESQGMMCSARELGLGDDHSGLMILPPDTPIGADPKELLGLDDVIFEIEVTPNRGDWASMIGVARELSALLGTPLRIPAVQVQETTPDAASMSSVTIEDSELCPRYIGRVLTDVKIGPSPQWLAQRLQAAGIRPINNVVDVTNFVLLETGHPLHAFDYDLLAENRIVVRTARAGERVVTIDGQDRELNPDMLVIADAKNPVAVAGVMGGRDSEVTDTTGRVFLESAFFKPSSVRRTSRVLGLQSEASQRFQRGADPEMALYAANRAAMLMQQLAGAKVAAGLLDAHPAPMVRKEVSLRYARTRLLLGTEVAPENQRAFIASLGFEPLDVTDTQCSFRVPTWRHDVSREADLIEEIARLHGYGNIATTLPRVRQTVEVLTPNDTVVKQIRHTLVANGLTEFFNWTFSCPDDVKQCELGDSFSNMVYLQNPLSEKQATLRSSLLPGLMASVSRNVRHGITDIMAFEVGPVFVPKEGSLQPDEVLKVALVLSVNKGKKQWGQPEQSVDFYDLKGYCECVLDFLGVEYSFDYKDFPMFQRGQSASILFDNKTIGVMGQVLPRICKVYDIEQSVFMLEMDMTALLDSDRCVPQFKAIPTFPPSRRDMAVLVDDSVLAGALQAAAAEVGGSLLKAVGIFDVYTGKQVPAGKKSVALSFLFQSDERTLTDEDTQKAWDRILKKLNTMFGAELR